MAKALRVRSLLPERTLWGNIGSVFENGQNRRTGIVLAAMLTGTLAVHASEPWWGQLFGSGDSKNSSASSSSGNAGGAPALIPSPGATSPSALPTQTPEATAAATTPAPEKSTAKPRSRAPLQCEIDPENVVINEEETLITFTPTVTGGRPDPATSYLVFDRTSDPFQEEYEVRQGMERPVSLEYDGREVVVYFVHPSYLPRDLRPKDSLNPTIPTRSLAYFQGQCGIVSAEIATTVS